MDNSSTSGNFMIYRSREDVFAMDESESDILDTPSQNAVHSTPGDLDENNLLKSPDDPSGQQEVSNLRQESIKTYLFVDSTVKKRVAAIGERSINADAMAVAPSVRLSPRPVDQPIGRPDSTRPRIFGQSAPGNPFTPDRGTTDSGTIHPEMRFPMESILELDQSEASNASRTPGSTAGLNDAVLMNNTNISRTITGTRDEFEVVLMDDTNTSHTITSTIDGNDANPLDSSNSNPPTAKNPFDGPLTTQNPLDGPQTIPKPQRKPRKINKFLQANKRTRAERGSNSDNEFTSFVYQADTNVPVLSQIQLPLNTNPAGAFWLDPKATNYTPLMGAPPDPWLSSQNMGTLTSTQVSHSNLLDSGMGPSNNNLFTSQPTTAPAANVAPTVPLNNRVPTPNVAHPSAGVEVNLTNNPATQKTPLITSNDKDSLISRLTENLTITVDSCKVGISDRHNRLVSLQTNSATPRSVEMSEEPLPNNPQERPTPPTGILAGAQVLNRQNTNGPVAKQAYFTRILPQALDLWRAYRGAAQKASTCKIRAAFTRDMASKRRFPQWAVGITPPPGIVVTPIGAMKLITTRRQAATAGMNTVASILDDRAADYSTTAESHLVGLKRHYEHQQPSHLDDTPYDYPSAIELAKKLVERASNDLTQRLEAEKARLKKCPEAALWTGIPIALVPANVRAVNDNASASSGAGNSTAPVQSSNPARPAPSAALGRAPSAYYADVIQLPPPTGEHPNTLRAGLNHVSPLSMVNAPNPNQVFATAWGRFARNPIPRKQQKRKQGNRSAPYKTTRENTPPQAPPQSIPAPSGNQNAFRQRRRRPANSANPQSTANPQAVQLSTEQVSFLQTLLKGFGK